jgi:sulfatase maturation enzyme AslB (radical SAM superfamily)
MDIEQISYGDKIKTKEFTSLLVKAACYMTLEQGMDLRSCALSKFFVNGKNYLLMDGKRVKIVLGEDYNYIFDKTNGDFKRWGKTYKDNPDFSPVGPEILDLEISVNGCPSGCRFCYKSNTNEPATNMTFDTFKKIIDSFPKTLTQIAFGITGIQTNPDFIRMMEYSREIGIVPNFTLAGGDLTDDIANKVSKLVGALAVSAYKADKNVCYNTVKKFTDLGIKQTNIHVMVSEETLDFVYEVLNDRMTDPRLANMNAIVFLGVKPKGRAKEGFHSLSTEKYRELISFCFKNEIAIGFDSCSAPKFEKTIEGMTLPDNDKANLIACSESCESSLFSSYINTAGEYWHCSFSERETGQGCVSVFDKNFMDVWYSDEVRAFRDRSINSMKDGCRYCQVFPSIDRVEFSERSEASER